MWGVIDQVQYVANETCEEVAVARTWQLIASHDTCQLKDFFAK